MASITQHRGKRGVTYRARIRKDGSYHTRSFSDLRSAQQWADLVESAAAALGSGSPAAAGHRLTDAIKRYDREQLGSKAAHTQRKYSGHLVWWRRRLGSTTLADITPQQITDYRDRLTRTLELSTVNGYLASLSAVMTVAMMD